VDGLPSAERALGLKPDLAEAHAVKAWYLLEQERRTEANEEMVAALRLDPESWEVNRIAGKVLFLQGRLQEAAACYEKAAELMDADYSGAGMLECCRRGLGDVEGLHRASRLVLSRVDKALETNPRDASAIANRAMSLAILGDEEQAREWADRALALEPKNYILRYNVACAFIDLGDQDKALDLIEDSLQHLGIDHIRHANADPDIAVIRDHPRFTKMIADARQRLGQ
jgi:adenylate cyclase